MMARKIFLVVSVVVAGLGITGVFTGWMAWWIGLCVGGYVVWAGVVVWRAPLSEVAPVMEKREPEELVVAVIRARGRARRADFLAAMRISRATLGRVLDEMERAGRIRQVGERKSAYYVMGG